MKVPSSILLYMVITTSIFTTTTITIIRGDKVDQQEASSLQPEDSIVTSTESSAFHRTLKDNTVISIESSTFLATLAVTSSKDNENFGTSVTPQSTWSMTAQNSEATAWTLESTSPSEEWERSGITTAATPVSTLADDNQGGRSTHLPPVCTTPSLTDQDSGTEDRVWISIVVCMCVLLFLLVICFLVWRRKKIQKKRNKERRAMAQTLIALHGDSSTQGQEPDRNVRNPLPELKVHNDLSGDHSHDVTSDRESREI